MGEQLFYTNSNNWPLAKAAKNKEHGQIKNTY
jgi:hypothetical protein